MSERKIEVQVGIVFVLAVAVLVSGVLWFKNTRLRARSQIVTVSFPKTSGLIRGDAVEVRGVPSGQVKDIRYSDGRALVILDLDRDVRFYEDTQIVLENVGIMGQKMIAVYPGGEGPGVDPAGKVLEGRFQPGVTEIMNDLAGTLAAFDRLANRLDRAMAAFDEQGGAFVRTLKNTEEITGTTAELLRESRGDLSASLRLMRLTMEDLHQTFEGREESIGRIIERTDRATARLDSTMLKLEASLDQVRRIGAGLEAGEGSLGRALTDEGLYDELVIAIRETRTLLTDLRENPKKYVKLSLF